MFLLVFIILITAGRDTLPVFEEDTLIVKDFYSHSFVFPPLVPNDIERLPYFLEPDLTYYVSSYPFVTQGGNFLYHNAIYIRGQDPWQTFFYYNGIPLVAPFHLVSISALPLYGMKKLVSFSAFHPLMFFDMPGNILNIVPLHKPGSIVFQSPLNTTFSYSSENFSTALRFFYPSFLIYLMSHRTYPLYAGDMYTDLRYRTYGASFFYSTEYINSKDTTADYIFSRFKSYAAGIYTKGIKVYYSGAERFSQVEGDTLFKYALGIMGIKMTLWNNTNFSVSLLRSGENGFSKLYFAKKINPYGRTSLIFSPVVYIYKRSVYFNPDVEFMYPIEFKGMKFTLAGSERSNYLTGKYPLFESFLIPDEKVAPERVWEINAGMKKVYSHYTLGLEGYLSYHQHYRFYYVDRFFVLPDSIYGTGFWVYNDVEEKDSVSFWQGSKLRYGINLKIGAIPFKNGFIQLLIGLNRVLIDAEGYTFQPSYSIPFKLGLSGAFAVSGWHISGDLSYKTGQHYATRVINYDVFPVFAERFYYYPLPSRLVFSFELSRVFRIKGYTVSTGVSLNRLEIRKGVSFYLYPEFYNLPSAFVKVEF